MEMRVRLWHEARRRWEGPDIRPLPKLRMPETGNNKKAEAFANGKALRPLDSSFFFRLARQLYLLALPLRLRDAPHRSW